MTTIIEQTRELSNQITSLAGSQITEQEARAFETRAQELSEAASLIDVPARLTEFFRAKGITVNPLTAESNTLKRAINDMAAKYITEPSNLLKADPQWRLVTRSRFAELSGIAMDHLREAWQAFVLDNRPAIDQGLRNIWEIFPAYREQALLVEERLAEFDNISQHLPTSREDLDRPEQLAAELDEIVRNLPTELPEPVRELFQAISEGTATAVHLTDGALKWLRENDLLQTLRITWRSD
jgi:uncharacterized protein involved in exopolysaccharide biosynthesis